MNQHTPGPWRYKPHRIDSNYMLIYCSSESSEGDNLRGYCGEANARLIAAAPDLLDALQGILRGVFDGPDESDAAMLVTKARAAITKAIEG